MRLSQARIRTLVAYFATQPVTAIYLVGSYARGDAVRGSDIDLIVTSDGNVGRSIDVRRCKRDLRSLIGLRIDLYEHHKLPKYIRQTILDGSVLLYAVADQVASPERTATACSEVSGTAGG